MVDLAVDVHDALEEMAVERSPALHVAIKYAGFLSTFKTEKIASGRQSRRDPRGNPSLNVATPLRRGGGGAERRRARSSSSTSDFVCAPRRQIIAFRRQMRRGPRGNPSLIAASPSTPGRGAALRAASYTSCRLPTLRADDCGVFFVLHYHRFLTTLKAFPPRPQTRKYRIPTLNAPRAAREVLAEGCELFQAAKGPLRTPRANPHVHSSQRVFRDSLRASERHTLAFMDAKLAHIDVKCAGGVAMLAVWGRGGGRVAAHRFLERRRSPPAWLSSPTVPLGVIAYRLLGRRCLRGGGRVAVLEDPF
ncbi:hypothetical protein FB107DRAFT_280334 [Schizophyllum commune]